MNKANVVSLLGGIGHTSDRRPIDSSHKKRKRILRRSRSTLRAVVKVANPLSCSALAETDDELQLWQPPGTPGSGPAVEKSGRAVRSAGPNVQFIRAFFVPGAQFLAIAGQDKVRRSGSNC